MQVIAAAVCERTLAQNAHLHNAVGRCHYKARQQINATSSPTRNETRDKDGRFQERPAASGGVPSTKEDDSAVDCHDQVEQKGREVWSWRAGVIPMDVVLQVRS